MKKAQQSAAATTETQTPKPTFKKVERVLKPKSDAKNRYFALNFTLSFVNSDNARNIVQDTIVISPIPTYPSLNSIREGILSMHADIIKGCIGEPMIGNIQVMEFNTEEDYNAFNS